MNYIIWKGINSNTIKGLLISELPPITKPKMRVQETQIDGVDGSIIEDLGYEVYDKTLQIGLTRDFDINEIISYFTGGGNIVFSNEPDKYYKVKIIDQIDYERLLRFRTASIKFRVQPFKYEEEEQEASEKSIEGNVIELENAKIPSFKLYGITKQESYSGKNLLDINNQNFGSNNTTTVISENSITVTREIDKTGTAYRAILFKCDANTNYKISGTAKILVDNSTEGQNFLTIRPTVNGGTMIARQNLDKIVTSEQEINIEFNSGEYTELTLWLYLNSGQLSDVNVSVLYNNLMISIDSGEYEPYVGGKASPSPDYPQEIEVGRGKNLLDIGTISFTNNKKYEGLNIPAGTYTFSAKITSNDTDSEKTRVYFYNNGTQIGFVNLSRNTRSSATFTVTQAIDTISLYASYDYAHSTDDTTTYEEVQLEKGSVATSYLPYKSISARSTGKNLFNVSKITSTSAIINNGNGTLEITQQYNNGTIEKLTDIAPNLEVGKTYTLSFNTQETQFNRIVLSTNSLVWKNGEAKVITQEMLNSNVYFYGLADNSNIISNIQIEKGSVATEYEPYKESSIAYNLDDNFLADKDYIENNILHKNVGKIVLNGSENWVLSLSGNNTNLYYLQMNYMSAEVLSNYFTRNENLYTEDVEGIRGIPSSNRLWVRSKEKTVSEFKTWLSNNNVEVYYELATPEQISLETTGELRTFEPNTIITNDLDSNMIIHYLEIPYAENKGNYYAKPIITIEGTGTIELIVNGNKLFRYTFPEGENEVVIDSEKQDAYLGSVLKNRNMSGEFPVFEIGENIITWEGKITNIKISSKSRWL